MVSAALRFLLVIAAVALCAPIRSAELRLSLPESVPPHVPVRVSLVWDGHDQLSRLTLPSADGLTLELAGESERMEVAGKVLLVYPLTLTVAAAGDVRLGPASALRADGTAVSSPPITVHCRAADARLIGAAWAEAEFLPHTALLNQPVQLVYHLYLRQGVDAYSAGLAVPEDAHLETRGAGQRIDTVLDADGTPWTLHTLSWSLSFATSGERVVGGIQEVVRDGERLDVPIAAAHLRVAEQPPNAPADFNGVVGALEVAATCAPEAIEADGGAVLTVTLRGEDAAQASPPALALPLGVRAYAQAHEDGEGVRHYRWDLIPEGPGRYAIGVGTLCYLDPDTRAYTRTPARQLVLAVAPTRPGAMAAAAAPAAREESTPTARGAERGDPDASALAIGLGFGGALSLALVAVLAERANARRIRAAVRRALARAMERADAEEAMRALRALRPQLGAQAHPLVDRLERLLDLARFGATPPDQEARDLARALLRQEPA
jgi:hypothetical protein